ncbi:DUF4230 domain-containing protein [Corynebacterium endometrii]|uniref:DUF4230 domain-containing protein n=1 Tax=Corynebacterium endometrii TaxID=2488819 RepID=A0A4P7QGL5_9CORY|nr:DUF4230 domain-containing protein [Corynebacterium endometrii]QCB28911.1 hypothetical protein CENDO_08195 [Corynebacterium endometrii]
MATAADGHARAGEGAAGGRKRGGSTGVAASGSTVVIEKTKRPVGYGCAAVLIGLFVGGLAIFGLAKQGLIGQDKLSVDSTTVEASFEDIAELATEEYHFTNVGRYEKEGLELSGLSIPFTGKHFLLTYEGEVKAGIKDFSQVTAEINDAERRVIVTLPKAEVLSSAIDHNSVVVYDQSMTPFNQIRAEDVSQFFASETDNGEKKALEAGLLDKATESARRLMKNHTEAMLDNTEQADYEVQVVSK